MGSFPQQGQGGTSRPLRTGNFWPRIQRIEGLAEWNRQVVTWVQTVADVRIHGTTRERPADRPAADPLGAPRCDPLFPVGRGPLRTRQHDFDVQQKFQRIRGSVWGFCDAPGMGNRFPTRLAVYIRSKLLCVDEVGYLLRSWLPPSSTACSTTRRSAISAASPIDSERRSGAKAATDCPCSRCQAPSTPNGLGAMAREQRPTLGHRLGGRSEPPTGAGRPPWRLFRLVEPTGSCRPELSRRTH